MTKNNKKACVFLLISILSAATALWSASLTLGLVSDTSRNDVFRSMGFGGELGFCTGDDFGLYANTALGIHSQNALYKEDGGDWLRVRSVSDGRRIYFARTGAGLEAHISGGGISLGLSVGAFLADRWFCLAGYEGSDWGRMCLYTFGLNTGLMFEKKLRSADAWAYIRADVDFDLWTWSQLQERRGGRRNDANWVQRGNGGTGLDIMIGVRGYF